MINTNYIIQEIKYLSLDVYPICSELKSNILKQAMIGAAFGHNKTTVIKDDKVNLLIGSAINDNYKDLFTEYEKVLYDIKKIPVPLKVIYNIKENGFKGCTMKDIRGASKIITTIKENPSVCKALTILSTVQFIQNTCTLNNIDTSKLFTISEKDCNLAYNLLKKNTESCNLSFEQYKELIRQGWTVQAISELYSTEFQITPGGKSLETLFRVYDLKDQLSFNSISNYGTTVEFLKDIIQDLDENLKQQIITSYNNG